MRTSRSLILAMLICATWSCKTNSELVTKVDKLLQSKRCKEIIKERDELCSDNWQLRNDTAELGAILRETERIYSELKDAYNDFSNKSGIQLSQLNTELKAKSKELEHKEKILLEREQRLKEMEAIISRQDSIVNALNNIVKNALLGFNSDELFVEMKNGKVYVSMSDKLLFKSGSANIEEKGKQAIKKLAEVLNKNSDIEIAIEGHTDNVPIKTNLYKDNWDLSVARATSIVRILNEENGVIAKRLTTSGKGEYFPAASNETTEGRAKNRRTEIILSPKLDELFKILQKS